MSTTYTFKRIEKKFLMTREQYDKLLPILKEHLKEDAYGETTVCSIYYDTPDLYLLRRSVERPFFKEKLRLRSYGVPSKDSAVFVEIKRKLDGVGYKRRISLPYSEAIALLRGKDVPSENPQIKKELLTFINRYRPVPALFLSYDRLALYDPTNPDFRVTIDRHMRYRTEHPEIPDVQNTHPLLGDDDRVLMEIKSSSAIPLWLAVSMSQLGIYQAPFSKAGTCYTQHMAGQRPGSAASALNTQFSFVTDAGTT
ncbi:MAG: polyphosphate polymerase domain-containing protein [Lachnospiraceae bacterium]|nr:polyphosphate polymerase domain-containing protein [Lachnospiraceae bacterium]